MVVRCNTRCWDSKRARRYYPGDQDDIDPKEPIALYFDFPPGTEVYSKERGSKTKPIKVGTRIVPGAVPVAGPEAPKGPEPKKAAAPRSRRSSKSRSRKPVTVVEEPNTGDTPNPE